MAMTGLAAQPKGAIRYPGERRRMVLSELSIIPYVIVFLMVWSSETIKRPHDNFGRIKDDDRCISAALPVQQLPDESF
jgi:hypothetical protein